MKRPKLRKCPECGRQHTGFTEMCGDCDWAAGEREADADIKAGRVERFSDVEGAIASLGVTESEEPVTETRNEGKPVTIAIPTTVTTNVTQRGFGSGKGRPRKHKDNAARQAAYRRR